MFILLKIIMLIIIKMGVELRIIPITPTVNLDVFISYLVSIKKSLKLGREEIYVVLQ